MFRQFEKEFLIHNNKDDQYHPSIISNPNAADFGITWTNKAINATSTRIMLKNYNASRTIDSSNIDLKEDLVSINEKFDTNRMHSKVTYLTNGDLLVTWHSDMQDGSGFGIYATLLKNNGNVIKEEFRVNTHTTSNQEYPSVAPLANGGFILVWHSLGQDTKQITSGVFAKIFDSSGTILKEEFQVNDYTSNNQDHPTIAILDNGNYIIAWQSFDQDGSGRGVYAKVYDVAHSVIKDEFRVNDYTKNNQEFPAVSKLVNNNFIVVWQSFDQDGSGHGVYAKLFNSTGDILKEEFKVNSYTKYHQKYPSVTVLSDESFMITWQSQNENNDVTYDIAAQHFTKEAVPIGEEFRVNDYTKNNQERPQLSALTDGGCVITWQSFGQDGYKSSIYGQIFTNENNTIYDVTNIPVPEVLTTDAPTQITTVAPVTAEVTTENSASAAPIQISTELPTSSVPTQLSTEAPIPTTSEIVITDVPTQITTAPVEPLIESQITLTPDTTSPATVADGTPQASTKQPTLVPTQMSTVVDTTTVIPQADVTEASTANPTPATSAVAAAIPMSSTDTSRPTSVASQPVSTLEGSKAAQQLSGNVTTNSTNVTISAVVTSAAPHNSISSILLNTSSTSPISGSETGNNFVITSNVKEATIIAGSGVDTFIFDPSNNSIVYIDNFGNNDLLNFSNVTNATSYAALNKTSGSTHFHLPYNQTVVVKNKYPHELNDSNVAFQNHHVSDTDNIYSTLSPVIVGNSENEQSTNNNINSETNSNAVYLIAGVTVGTVVVTGGIIAGAIAGIMIYRHKRAVAAATVKIAETVSEHLPYGNEEEGSSSGILSGSDSSVVDMAGSGSINDVELSGANTVTIIG